MRLRESHACNSSGVETKSYTTAEVCRLVGIKQNLLSSWIARGYVPGQEPFDHVGPPPKDQRRQFTPEQLRVIRKLKKRSDDLRKGLGAAQ